MTEGRSLCRDHASVTLPGVLQINVGHINFRYV